MTAAFKAGTRLPMVWAQAGAGAQLRAVRLDRRISQRHLAQEAGVSQSFVSRLEAGRCDATLTIWRKLFEALGCWAPFVPVAFAEDVGDLLDDGRDERERRRDGGLACGWYR